MTTGRVLLCLLVVASLFYGSDALRLKGRVTSDTDWVFVEKFCFDTNGLGYLNWTAWSPYGGVGSNLKLLFYDDQDYSWPTAYHNRNKWSCEKLEAAAKGNRTIVSGNFHSQPFNDPARPHFWYFVLANCGGKVKDVEYDFLIVNAENGGQWTVQFSFDEQGLPEMYLFYWLVFLVMTVVHLIGVWRLIQTGLNHPTIRIITAALIVETFALFFSFIHYVVYAGNGIGAPGLKDFAELLDMAVQITIVFVLILFSYGWGISKQELDEKRVISILMSLFALLYIIMFIVDVAARNRASTLYIYESAPGILILLLRMAAFAWFLFNLRKSILSEGDSYKRGFYLNFGVLFSIWFVMLVIIVIIAALCKPPWRYKTVQGMYLTMNTLAFGVFVYLLWPTRVQNYFAHVGKADMLLGKNSSPYETL